MMKVITVKSILCNVLDKIRLFDRYGGEITY